MQLQRSITQAFVKKGYSPSSSITKRQFHILMNTLLSQTNNSHKLFNESITNQIWKQTQDRALGNNLARGNLQSKSYNSSGYNRTSKAPQQSIKTQTLTLTLIDAIQILTNRILECEDRLEQLVQKRKRMQEQMKYAKVQQTQESINTLKQDLAQFNTNFKMLTEPFMVQNSASSTQLKRKLSNMITRKRTSSIEKTKTDKAGDEPNRVTTTMVVEENFLGQASLFQKKMKDKFHLDNSSLEAENTKNINIKAEKSSGYEDKRCSLYFLIFLMILEVSVCLLKYNFVNVLLWQIQLIIFLIGFLVVLQKNFMPGMTAVAFWSCLISILIDGGWLFLYSGSYLNSKLNSSLKHELKPFYQYIWFITVLQVCLKIIYLFFIRQYLTKNADIQELKQQEQLQNKTSLKEYNNTQQNEANLIKEENKNIRESNRNVNKKSPIEF